MNKSKKTRVKPTLSKDSDEDFVLNSQSVWITVNNVSVYIRKTSEGVEVELLPLGDETVTPLATASVDFETAREALEEAGKQ